jgi:hypothetical protein
MQKSHKPLSKRHDGTTASAWRSPARTGCLAAMLVFMIAGDVGTSPALAAEAPCPNEALRAESSINPETHLPLSLQLPDCRAYELVSPPFTEGFAITGVATISVDGSQMIAGSFGAFAGSESDPLSVNELTDGGPVYKFTRTGSKWEASPVDPSPARFPIQGFVRASSDLSRTLWMTREPTESIYALDLQLREPDGSFVKVGSMVPPSVSGPPTGYVGSEAGGLFVVGAASNLSHVLFKILAPSGGGLSFLWPGDTTSIPHGTSLYEYAGTGNSSPELVGVNNEGVLISNCETWLGGPLDGGNKYNAVSSDGETVFFTAIGKSDSECSSHASVRAPEVDELYARVNGSKSVAISEPPAAQCSACRTTVKRPAEFQGASETGSEALFTTEQELLAGDTGENLYEYDFDNPEGEKIVRVSAGAPEHESSNPGVEGVARVSEDGTHAYFVARAVLTGPNEAGKGKSPTVGEPNLYVFEHDATYPQGRTTFVATLSEGDAQDWNSENRALVQATPDGRFLVFTSEAPNLTPDDTSTVRQIFEYDALQEKLVRVSVGQQTPRGYECSITANAGVGFNCDGNTEESRDGPTLPESRAGLAAVSNDGSYVVFQSADALTPHALDNQLLNEYEGQQTYAQNVYEYHSSVGSDVGSIADGNVFLISDGRDRTLHNVLASGVQLYGTDAAGQDVFFSSGDPLVAQDTDTQVGVYDARVDGGFAAPVSPMECGGEACLPGSSATRLFSAPESSIISGSGNLTPTSPSAPARVTPKTKPKPVKCKRDFVRKHNRCVKNKKKKVPRVSTKRRPSDERPA